MASLIGPFLVKVADLLDEEDTPGLGIGMRLAGNVVDLLGTVLAERLDATPDDPDIAHRALMLQITSFIEEHLGEADLAPAQIAAAHHISLRQLHKLFHASGTTVAGWIRQRRLEHCGHDLRDPRLRDTAGGRRRGPVGLPGPGALQPAVQGRLRRRPARLPGQPRACRAARRTGACPP